MTTDNRYNGWTNYATWRVNLELFDRAYDPRDYWSRELKGDSAYDLAVQLEEFALNYVDDADAEPAGRAIVSGWVRAFLADVNWLEIAEHMMDAYREEEA